MNETIKYLTNVFKKTPKIGVVLGSGLHLFCNHLENKLRHWGKIILNASQQCGRLSLPQVREPTSLPELIEDQNFSYSL